MRIGHMINNQGVLSDPQKTSVILHASTWVLEQQEASSSHDTVFGKLKGELTQVIVLTLYNTDAKHKNSVDASAYGLEAVLLWHHSAIFEVSSTATSCPEMFWDCPCSLPDTVESTTGYPGQSQVVSPGLSQVLVRENTNIPQYLVS